MLPLPAPVQRLRLSWAGFVESILSLVVLLISKHDVIILRSAYGRDRVCEVVQYVLVRSCLYLYHLDLAMGYTSQTSRHFLKCPTPTASLGKNISQGGWNTL